MRNKILTISIAAYNKQDYIRQCLDSLIINEIIDDIEVFVIDDGGVDNTYEIAKEYEYKYPNSIYAIHKINEGYGSTVNYSIKNATGKFFKLLDGDDWFDKNGFYELVSTLKITNADLVFTQFSKIRWNGRIKKALSIDTKYINKTFLIDDFNEKQGIPMHAVTYKTEVLRKSNLLLPNHLLYTDNYYVCIPLPYVKEVLVKGINVYNYRIDQSSQSCNRDVLVKHLYESECIPIDLVKYYNKIVSDGIIISNYFRYRVASSCVDHLVSALKQPICLKSLKYVKEFDKKMHDLSTDIYFTMQGLNRNASRIINFLRKTKFIFYLPISLFLRRL